MNDLYLYNFDKTVKDHMVFWSGGNLPTQNSLGVSLDDAYTWFKALLLLSDKIVASSSFYYESEITRKITREFDAAFRSGDALYFIDENISNFSEHGLLKIQKSPKSLGAYNDIERVKTYGRQLDTLGTTLRRPPDSISKKIQYIWASDIYSTDSKSLGMFLQKSMKNTSNREEVSLLLSGIAASPPVDFVWEYIASEVNKFSTGLPKGFDAFARNRLSEIYALACANILELQLDLTLMNRISQYDTNLFLLCMSHAGVLEVLKTLTPKEVISLKQRDEVIWLRSQYFNLINAVNNNEKTLRQSFEHAGYIMQSSTFPIFQQGGLLVSIGIKDLIKNYFKNNKKVKEYKKPVDILLYTYDAIVNDISKQNIFKWLDEFVNMRTAKDYPIFGQQILYGGTSTMFTNVVILTALRDEYDAVTHALQSCGMVDLESQPRTFSVVSEHGSTVNGVLIETGVGQVKAAIMATTAVMKYSPDIVVLTGIAAGVSGDSDVNIGDIIVAEQQVYYEWQKIKENHPNDIRFQVTRGGTNLLTTARNLPRDHWINNTTIVRPAGNAQDSLTHYGVVLTGDKVVADTDFVTELTKSWSRAIGIEMESYGASMAVEHSKPRADFLMVKSVSDKADKNKDDLWHKYCTNVAAAYTVALLKRHAYPNRQGINTELASIPENNKLKHIPGPVLVEYNQKLYADRINIATYLGIPSVEQARFNAGFEIIGIYEWLKSRNRVSELLDAIIGIGREDVIANTNKSET